VILIAVLLVLSGAGCASNGPTPPAGSAAPAGENAGKSPLEEECERELLYLDERIEMSARSAVLPAAVLAEAAELRRSAAGLILDGHYELALEMIEEAIVLLRET
jgi:hypothetical protein